MPPAVALINYKSRCKRWRNFCQTGTFRGVFSTYILFISLVGSAQLRWQGTLYFLASTGPVGDYTGAHAVIFRQKDQRSCDRRVERGGYCIFRVPNILEGCNGWGEGRGILYSLWYSGKIYTPGSRVDHLG
jgi:hypothetical protein